MVRCTRYQVYVLNVGYVIGGNDVGGSGDWALQLYKSCGILQRSIVLSATGTPASDSAFILASKVMGRLHSDVGAYCCSKVGRQGRRRCGAMMTAAICGLGLRGNAPFMSTMLKLE